MANSTKVFTFCILGRFVHNYFENKMISKFATFCQIYVFLSFFKHLHQKCYLKQMHVIACIMNQLFFFFLFLSYPFILLICVCVCIIVPHQSICGMICTFTTPLVGCFVVHWSHVMFTSNHAICLHLPICLPCLPACLLTCLVHALPHLWSGCVTWYILLLIINYTSVAKFLSYFLSDNSTCIQVI